MADALPLGKDARPWPGNALNSTMSAAPPRKKIAKICRGIDNRSAFAYIW